MFQPFFPSRLLPRCCFGSIRDLLNFVTFEIHEVKAGGARPHRQRLTDTVDGGMADDAQLLPIFGPPPEVPLCQHQEGSCAACCGVDNFADRSERGTHARLKRRTDLVTAAWPDEQALIKARDTLLALEEGDILFPLVKVCPFAGYVVDGDTSKVGCLIHPTRHPEGKDLRDMSVYSSVICGGHFFAPHDWLRPREVALAQTARGLQYGRVVTDAGLVKSLVGMFDERLARSVTEKDYARAASALQSLWKAFEMWPWKDKDPRRFGGVRAVGDDATERTCDALFGFDLKASRAERVLLDGLASEFADEDEARAGLDRLRHLVNIVTAQMERVELKGRST